MGFRVKRIDYDEDTELYLTENNEFGTYEEAKVYDDFLDAFADKEDPPYDETGTYDYEVEDEDDEDAVHIPIL